MAPRAGPTVVGAFIALLLVTPSPVPAQDAILIVRHAEKETSPPADPPLSADGRRRAEALRDSLKGAGITAIITSPFRRTKETANPLATALSITPRIDPMDDPVALVDKIRHLPGGGNVLVVGHSDTIPQLLKALGHSPPVCIGEAEFDNLFVVTPGDVTHCRVIRLRYRP